MGRPPHPAVARLPTLPYRPAMPISAERVTFDEDTMWVALSDGRTLGIPLAWFPRLMRATVAERAEVAISPFGQHWEALDEDISVAGLIAGRGIWRRWDRWCEGKWRAQKQVTVALAF